MGKEIQFPKRTVVPNVKMNYISVDVACANLYMGRCIYIFYVCCWVTMDRNSCTVDPMVPTLALSVGNIKMDA